MQNLITFQGLVFLKPVPEFRVSSFFKESTESSFSVEMRFNQQFYDLIVEPTNNLQLSLPKSKLEKYALPPMFTSKEARSKLGQSINRTPVLTFLPQMRALLEENIYSENSIEKDGKVNIFNVDLNQLGNEFLFCEVRVNKFPGGEWLINAYPPSELKRSGDVSALFNSKK